MSPQNDQTLRVARRIYCNLPLSGRHYKDYQCIIRAWQFFRAAVFGKTRRWRPDGCV